MRMQANIPARGPHSIEHEFDAERCFRLPRCEPVVPVCPPLELGYTTDDDGIHVNCDSCRFRKHLGHCTSVDVEEAEAEHQDQSLRKAGANGK